MKIAIFSDTFPPQTNGVANVARHSAEGLAELGHQIFVFTVLKKEKNRANTGYKNITVIALPSIPALVYPAERLSLPLGFSLGKLKKLRPDIIHTHTPFSVGWEAVLASKLLKIPLAGTHHTFYDHYLKHAKIDYAWGIKFSWKYTALYYNRCDLVLSPSAALAETLKTNGLKKPIEIVKNFINTDLFQPAKNKADKETAKKKFGIKDCSIAYMGRLSYEKSVDQLLKTFVLLAKKMPKLKLMLIGDGPERANLEKLANDLGVKNNVIFAGFLYKKDLTRALQANDIFLTASKSENMPLSVLEAMAAGLPVIAVRENGLAEIIKENVNGFFAKTGNPADMAEKIFNLLAKPDLLAEFGRASRALAMEYSKEKVLNNLENLYIKTIAEYKKFKALSF